jgi:endonuclease-3
MLDKEPELLCPDLEKLQKLPWVGIKTAKVVSYVLFWSKVIAADTHVHRVANRLWLVETKTPEKTSETLEKIVPDKYKEIAHHTLILFGRYHCTAKNPKCDNCELAKICKYKKSL